MYSKVNDYIFISRNHEILAQLSEAHKNGNHKKIGLALGYPESAVDAYVNDRLKKKLETEKSLTELSGKKYKAPEIDRETISFPLDEQAFLTNSLPTKGLFIHEQVKDYKEVSKKFRLFVFSKNNWREEIEVVKGWRDVIKEKFPNLYGKVVK